MDAEVEVYIITRKPGEEISRDSSVNEAVINQQCLHWCLSYCYNPQEQKKKKRCQLSSPVLIELHILSEVHVEEQKIV